MKSRKGKGKERIRINDEKNRLTAMKTDSTSATGN